MAGTDKTRRINIQSVRGPALFRSRARCTAGLAAAALLVLASEPGFPGSNLAPAGYPDPQCGEQPEPPKRPDRFQFRAELDAYNKQVSVFNEAEKRFVRCIQAYLDNAVFDIQMIRQKVDAAARSAGR